MESLDNRIAKLLDEPKYSDLEIICDSHVFRVHRSVVCLRSEVLERECDGEYKEAGARKIEHTEFDRFAVDRMLQFMYRGDYTLRDSICGQHAEDESFQSALSDQGSSSVTVSTAVSENEDPLVSHVYVYAIADYYQVSELQTLALKKFTKERKDRKDLTTDQLTHIAAILYANTAKSATRLRAQMLALACEWPSVSIDSPQFMQAIAEQPGLQEFSSELLFESVKRQRAELKKLNDTVESHSLALRLESSQLECARAEIGVLEKRSATAKKDLGDEQKRSAVMKRELGDEQKKVANIEQLARLDKCHGCRAGRDWTFTYKLVKVGGEYKAECGNCSARVPRY